MEKLKAFFNHPIVVAIGYLVGIVGFILGIVFYLNGIKEPNLTYYVSPTRTPIVQKGSLDNFLVTFHGVQITNDLSSAEILIWNQGKLPIHRADILKTITLKMVNGETIYQTTAKSSRDVIGYNSINNTNSQPGVFQFDWKILEHNDGIRLQIIYGGNVNVPITVEGVVEGQKNINKYRYTNPIHSIHIVLWVIAFLVILLALLFHEQILHKNITKMENMQGELSVRIAIAIIVLTGGIYNAIILFRCILTLNEPPFGF